MSSFLREDHNNIEACKTSPMCQALSYGVSSRYISFEKLLIDHVADVKTSASAIYSILYADFRNWQSDSNVITRIPILLYHGHS